MLTNHNDKSCLKTSIILMAKTKKASVSASKTAPNLLFMPKCLAIKPSKKSRITMENTPQDNSIEVNFCQNKIITKSNSSLMKVTQLGIRTQGFLFLKLQRKLKKERSIQGNKIHNCVDSKIKAAITMVVTKNKTCKFFIFKIGALLHIKIKYNKQTLHSKVTTIYL